MKSPKRLFVLPLMLTLAACNTAVADDAHAFKGELGSYDARHWYISDGWTNGNWQSCEWRRDAIAFENGRMKLTLSDHGGKQRPIGCGEIRTKQKFGYGLFEARMRVAKGSGLNTAFFTYIGPPNGVPEWDEIDFEFLGKDTTGVQLNYYTNGKNPGGTTIALGFDASQAFHNYAFDWEPDKIRWYVDGKLVHETAAGARLPHNPSAIFLSLWSGSKQEDNWLGPFAYKAPATAEYEWAAYTPPGVSCAFPESMTCKHAKAD